MGKESRGEEGEGAMSDDQLQALFAGMERHLDNRADAIEQGVAAAEQRLEARFDAKIEALETKLLSEFWKWARGIEARMRMHDAINAASLERLSGIEERVLNLEKPPQ
jgi:hypothetical protein